ncbi:MAG: bifunctional diguanylate cyclase/phosphodiesterase [Gammaproteobacteria bacterium]|jgi:diguanylate cyclase (GGDEF)-like protein
MKPTRQAVSEPLVIDESACHAYVTEIREILGVDLFAIVVDVTGRPLWTDDPLRSEQLQSALRRVPPPDQIPCRQPISAGWTVVQLPMRVSSDRPLALRLAIHDEIRPELSDVESVTKQPLECLARQIQINSALTASWLHPSIDLQSHTEVDDLLAVPARDSELGSTLEALCRQWRARAGLAALAVHLPERDLLVSDSDSGTLESRLPDIISRAHAQVLQRGKPMKARLSVSGSREVSLFCRRVTDSSERTLGTVHLLDYDADKPLSKLARQFSTRLAQWLRRNEQTPALLSRSELLDAISAMRRRDPGLLSSLAYIDADKIHAINDTFGYSAGDQALETLGRVLCEQAGSRALIAHLTSDRFAAFLPGASAEQAVATTQRLLRHYSMETIDDNERSIALSASAGIATMSDEHEDPESLLIVAEVAARAAKERGGNQYALHQNIDDSVIQRRSDVDKVGFLQMALIENRFILFAQKIAPLTPDRPAKYELLTRLEGENNTVGHPGEMLSAAERYHMMTALDRWVINTALTSLASAENSLEVNLCTFCINVSAQSLADDSFPGHIETRIAETGVAPDTLCFEITETSLVRNIDRAQRFISRLQRLGCQVALDDFGTGYSSFAYLKHLPVNFLKIDGSFVRDMLESPLSRAIVASIVNIASVTGATTVAEHVESEAISVALRELGVDYVQGFAVHRPEPLTGILNNLGEQTYGIEPEPVDMIDLDEYTQPARVS